MLTQQPNRPFCQHCKSSLAKSNGISKHGFTKWHKYCSNCSKIIYNPKFGYFLEKKNYCEECKFKPIDTCQLDLIYLDNNIKNKDVSNLKTLCANCSRLHYKNIKEKNQSIYNITIDSDVRI